MLPIETARLTLRAFVEEDLKPLFDIQCRPDVTRYLMWEPRSLDEVRESLAEKITNRAPSRDGDVLSIAVVLRETGELLGDLTLFYRSQESAQVEIGFVFHPRFQGKGYATEASRELVRLAFEEFGAHRAFGRADARNTASCRLMERLGLRREAHLRENEYLKGEWTDEVVYAMLASEWVGRTTGQ
ncbi:RimJ/RimL family protein N-acetyltransferase [Herbihabitans rhizosphaerae]|uniref:RimJ/RimL family protein N-acetyltransferase n=1 Tax=Herbihabitans rhizosphaerae TaxID=1872711 RepID=A0A4V2ESZ5_9PSEU|nr:GNAT family protein [Herbihabitans rhizosphaerae]RZS39293.1 RimJ/RimL family protein N-acetyltransferase [Herbihabitans rhizosphaerae]